MSPRLHTHAVLALIILLLPFSHTLLESQVMGVIPQVPDKFTSDLEMAAHLRPLLHSQSTEPSGRYAAAGEVLRSLVEQAQVVASPRIRWELRIVDADLLNAFSSPDGSIYVDRNLAQLAGANRGLWAAILSHEIIHVIRRDWARRYLYEKSLRANGGSLVLGAPGSGAGAWTDSQYASEAFARACRQLEVEADAEGMMLMAHAGYHPNFVAALHHLLQAQLGGRVLHAEYAMHPRWDIRDHELGPTFVVAGQEFDRLWPDRPTSPGGEPPVVVFADTPTARSVRASEWEIRFSIRCENLAGAVAVVVRARTGSGQLPPPLRQLPASSEELRQFTGCTSNKTIITFLVEGAASPGIPEPWSDVYVLDESGAVLARADLPKLR